MTRETPPHRRFPVPLERVPGDDRIDGHFREAARQTVARLAARPGRPAAMAAFDDLLTGQWRADEIRTSGRKVVGYFCGFVPEELVLAAGAVPLRLDLGLGAAARAGARVFSGDICPEVRAIVGAHLGGLPYHRLADVRVVPTSCDGKRKLPRVLDGEVWILELPQSREGARGRAQWHEQVRVLARRLERLTGRTIRRGPLREAISTLNRRSALVRRLNRLRCERPGVLSGQDALLVIQASFVADAAWWVDRAEALVREIEARPSPASDPARILLTGSPVLFPDLKLLEIVEEQDAVVVADDLCSGTEHLYHPTVIDEPTTGGMIRAAADRTLAPCVCPCFVGGDARIQRLLDRAGTCRADGVIHHTLRLCMLFDMELPAVAAALRGAVPLLAVTTDHGAEDAPVVRNRVEAFLEMIRDGP